MPDVRQNREGAYAIEIRRCRTYRPGIDARHVEAYMRLEHATLDAIPTWQFEAEVKLAIECIEVGGIENAEALAQSYGM